MHDATLAGVATMCVWLCSGAPAWLWSLNADHGPSQNPARWLPRGVPGELCAVLPPLPRQLQQGPQLYKAAEKGRESRRGRQAVGLSSLNHMHTHAGVLAVVGSAGVRLRTEPLPPNDNQRTLKYEPFLTSPS